ncbi:MAG TPA: DUF4173 domain-containing protein [Blastocatellia bacterium]|nr:DUF4173 domain-containing protein [Blastocatellia bacterium]
MNEETRLGLKVMVAAVVLGIAGDILLIMRPLGINLFIWMAFLLTATVLIIKREKIDAMGDGKLLIAPIIFFSAAFAWRDSATLHALDMLALMGCLLLGSSTVRAGRLRIAGFAHYAASAIISGFETAFGFLILIFGDIEWKSVRGGGLTRRVFSVLLGLLIATPIIIVFGSLLASADSAFASILSGIFTFNSDWVMVHLIAIAAGSWFVAGFLHRAFLGSVVKETKLDLPFEFSLGITEISIILGSLDLLFLSFVIVQFKYFFGGAARVVSTAGLSYAEYARSGFFELVTVTALVLPLLLAAHWLLKKGNQIHERIFKGLAIAMISLLSVIMVSAVQRMRLYQAEYGMTELRLYTTVFMGWLAIVFAWFIYTVLRGQRERFVFGAMTSAFAAIVILNAINPDAMIVRINAQRAEAGKRIDTQYLMSLSADAVPALIDAFPDLPEYSKKVSAKSIIEQWSNQGDPGWRSWNWSRSRARGMAGRNQQMLRGVMASKN